ncbi:MAG: hypothetical protein ACREMW_04985, partial [Gemmatimonadales bacterium]
MINERDREPIVTIAFLAANADGRSNAEEQAQLRAVLERLGMGDLDTVVERVMGGQLRLAEVVAKLSG